VQISQFAADTADELRKALEAIQAETAAGRPVTGIVLDLRNNPGGLLHQALRVGSQFLPEGQVILNERNAEGRVSTFKSQGRGLAREISLVVLINEGSASAAEILSGAIQANDRGQLVGMTTVGTGTVLVPFTLSDGSMIRLGVTNWLTPDMRLIKGQGIEPDVMVEQAPEVEKVDAYLLAEAAELQALPDADLQFEAALDLLQGDLASGS
jgi:carboxyl-terminal processing protease